MKKNWRGDFAHFLRDCLHQKVAPGFQCLVGWKDQSLGLFCEGFEDFKDKRPVRPKTWFDLASLTKVICTVDLLILARQSAKIPSLDATLRPYFPFLKSELKNISIADLLNHRSGLSAIFEEAERSEAQLPTREDRVQYFLRRIDETYEESRKGQELYSDIGFILLGAVLERLAGRSLRHQFRQSEIMFRPRVTNFPLLRAFIGGRTFASELALDGQSWLTGIPQDPRAQWLGGEAGHAGLFGTARGIESWAQDLYRAYFGKSTRLSDKAVREFCDFSQKKGRFLNGFDTPDAHNSQAGRFFGPTTIGHLGYSGSSFWMDLESGARVILLCHRAQPGIDPETLRQIRPQIHDWLHENLFLKLKEGIAYL